MQQESQSMGLHCPSCGSESIRKSRRQGIRERVLSYVSFRRPYRCENCDKRFWAAVFDAATKSTAHGQAH